MSILLTGVNESLQVVLGAAATTTQFTCAASYADQGGAAGDNATLTNGTTAVTLVAAPAAGVSRVVSGLSIYNGDTAAKVVTVTRKVSSTSYTLCKVTLAVGYHLFYDNATGWKVIDDNGAIAQSGGGGGVAIWGGIAGILAAQNVQTVVSAATVTPTFSNDMVKVTALAVNVTLANPTGTARDGFGMVIRIKDAGAAKTISYGTQYRAIGVTLPVATVISKTLYLACIWNATDTKLDVIAVGQEA
jgi:hypothetical protein